MATMTLRGGVGYDGDYCDRIEKELGSWIYNNSYLFRDEHRAAMVFANGRMHEVKFVSAANEGLVSYFSAKQDFYGEEGSLRVKLARRMKASKGVIDRRRVTKALSSLRAIAALFIHNTRQFDEKYSEMWATVARSIESPKRGLNIALRGLKADQGKIAYMSKLASAVEELANGIVLCAYYSHAQAQIGSCERDDARRFWININLLINHLYHYAIQLFQSMFLIMQNIAREVGVLPPQFRSKVQVVAFSPRNVHIEASTTQPIELVFGIEPSVGREIAAERTSIYYAYEGATREYVKFEERRALLFMVKQGKLDQLSRQTIVEKSTVVREDYFGAATQ